MSGTLRRLERAERIDVPLCVVAASPGEEVFGAATLLLRCRRAHVIHVTDGAPDDAAAHAAGWDDRERLAVHVSRAARVALGFAGLGGTRIHELGTRGAGAFDRAAAIARRIAALLERVRPEIVVTHAYEGEQDDRDATCLAVQLALQLSGVRAIERIEMTSRSSSRERPAGRFLPGSDDQAARRLSRLEREAKRRMLACLGVSDPMHAEEDVRELLDAGERFRAAPAYGLGAMELAAFARRRTRGLLDAPRRASADLRSPIGGASS